MNTGSEQVSEAGATMKEIVAAVTRVTDIMGEISSASDEQSRGIEQVSWPFRRWTASPAKRRAGAAVRHGGSGAGRSVRTAAPAVAAFRLNGKQQATAPRTTHVKTPQLLRPATAGTATDSNWETF